MKKQVSKLSLGLLLLSALGTQAQQVQPCVTYDAMEQHFATDPQARLNFQKAQNALLAKSAQDMKSAARTSAFEYTVPVVFHVLYECGVQTISDADLIQVLDQVNKDFARTSSDTNLIFGPFKSLYIPSDIKFMLAKKDPQGNCINGIVRHIDPKHNWSQSAAQQTFYWPYTWDPTKYLNIYIVSTITSANPQPGVTTVGYTYLPGTWPSGNAHDAIVYDGGYLTGGNPPKSRSLSHEIGHWLGLPHTFGNTNNPGVTCGDDGIGDTPATKGNIGGCPVSTTNSAIQCSGSVSNYFRNVENIMNYSDCPRNFTSGQTTVMRNVLAGTVSNRQNLWQPANLFFTGVNNSGVCVPKAEFFSNTCAYTVCAGQSLTFRDNSSNATITSHQWTADNFATIASPSASQTSITFPVVGSTNVTLTASSAAGSHDRVRTITVMDPTPYITTSYFESFENPGLPPNWQLVDTENDGKTWQQTTAAAYDQITSYFIDGEVHPPGSSDHLVMPMMDVKNNPGYKLEFAYAFARESTTQNDILRIQGSRDCGGSWSDIVTLSAALMANGSGGTDPNPFFPLPNQWKTYDISAHPQWINYLNSSSVLVRFNFEEHSNGYGNNMFIDAVNFISGPVGVNELTKSFLFNVYPNPTSGEATVRFNLNDPATVRVSVLDVLGKEVLPATEQYMTEGEKSIVVNADRELKSGIYFVKMSVNGATMSSKLIIE